MASYSSTGSGAAAAAAAAPAASPGGGCSVGTALEDLAGVEVGDTLFVGEPCKKEQETPSWYHMQMSTTVRRKDDGKLQKAGA